MRKPDEIALFEAVRQRGPYIVSPTVRQIIAEIGVNDKRAAAVLQKWAGRGWYDYGVNVLAGWITPDAPERLSIFEHRDAIGAHLDDTDAGRIIARDIHGKPL